MNAPLISVIVPAYNNEATLGIALDSMLAQTYPQLEIIVVDDSSTDGTKVIAEEYAKHHKNIHVITGADDPNRFNERLQRNINAGWSARNSGLAIARGEYITFQDADDASLLNRITIQYETLKKYDVMHLCLDYLPFETRFLNKSLDVDAYMRNHPVKPVLPDTLYALSQRTKGVVPKLFPQLNQMIPFHVKRMRGIQKLFFGSLASYPGAGNSPLFHHSVLEKVRFRPLKQREWPSFMGRGADRDFNFHVAETFRKSAVFPLPAYLWDNRSANLTTPDIAPYLS